ncbi:MAG: hypothetical protein AMXMBFR64_61780 [Myxococcales bacterium]
MSAPLLSACIIARDEERCIGRCIASLRGLVDEVVVVDTGSVDATPQIARSLGARVYHHPWADDFSLHRNQSIEYAEGVWCLIVDADEHLEPGDFEETRRRLAEPDLPNVLMIKHWSSYPWEQSVLEYLARLVRKGSGIRYIHPIHEQLAVRNEEALLSNLVVRHDGYEHANLLASKHVRNLAIAEKMEDDEPHAWHCRMRSLAALGRWPNARESALRLLALPEVAPPLRVDAHLMVAASQVDVSRDEVVAEYMEHLAAARELEPCNPDIPFLEMFRFAVHFLRALQSANTPGSEGFLRIGSFWRTGFEVERLVRMIIGDGPRALHRDGQVLNPK